MGSIDVDPASNCEAQQTVQAGLFYTEQDDGLAQPWVGNVWMNPPYDARINLFIDKLLVSRINQAIVMTNSKTDTRWWQRLAKASSAICYHAGRIKSNGSKNSPTCGHTFTYLGANPERFAAVFGEYGVVLIPGGSS